MEESFLIDSLTTNNATYRDSLTLNAFSFLILIDSPQ